MKIWMATAAAATVLFAPLASAKVLIDIDGGLGYSFNSLNEGSLANDSIDLQGTNSTSEPVGLNQDAENGLYAWTKISVPIFPDVGLKYQNLYSTGTNTVAQNVEYGGESQTFTGELESEFDLSYFDLSLTYGIPLPSASVDFGLNFRSLIGGFSAEVDGTNQSIDTAFEVGGTPIIVPMLYLGGSFDIPVADVRLGGELKTLPIGDTNITDLELKGTWFAPLPTNMLVKLGVEAGYRNYSLTIGDSTLGADTSDFASDVNYSGFFAGAALSF
ncbi:TIGR04219 family outer membrane beta-barrel protein [Saccharospirillum alexandrii]|uniref:TIGR04219 family outer membrane beta-barrel protein n=1 Tax=Saccharospirillum alexandrii TaxID=2448477 RepID=UPI00373533AC